MLHKNRVENEDGQQRSIGLRILTCSHTWEGATDYGFTRAFRRAGHSVTVVSDAEYFPYRWNSLALRVLRRFTQPLIVAEFQRSLIEAAAQLKPELLFVFKGALIEPNTIDAIRTLGSVAINVYPDVSFTVHGPLLPKSLPRYDWIFTTKSFGVANLERELGIRVASFMPHGFDPEVHAPVALDAKDRAKFASEVSFIGTWSPKKEALLAYVRKKLPALDLKVWGNKWERAGAFPAPWIKCEPVLGREYAKAIAATAINLAILIEAHGEASSGDLTTTRTFEIPAVGGFMLHERTKEAQSYFTEGSECAMFGDADELVAKIRHYLGSPEERSRIAAAGHRRCVNSCYAVDQRAAVVVEKAREIAAIRSSPLT
jgi:spore maturation protein CgeB